MTDRFELDVDSVREITGRKNDMFGFSSGVDGEPKRTSKMVSRQASFVSSNKKFFEISSQISADRNRGNATMSPAKVKFDNNYGNDSVTEDYDIKQSMRKASTMRYKMNSNASNVNDLFGGGRSKRKDEIDAFEQRSSRRVRNPTLKVSEIKEVEQSDECETPERVNYGSPRSENDINILDISHDYR